MALICSHGTENIPGSSSQVSGGVVVVLRTPNLSEEPGKFVVDISSNTRCRDIEHTYSQEHKSAEVVHRFDLLGNERGIKTYRDDKIVG